MPHTTTILQHGRMWVLVVLAFLAAGFSIGTGIAQALNTATTYAGLRYESDFGFKLWVWTLVWGSVMLVALIVFLVDHYSRTDKNMAPGAGAWIWGILMFFVLVPWLLVGQIMLLRHFHSTSTTATWLYAVSIADLVLSYMLVAYFAWHTSYHIGIMGMALATYKKDDEAGAEETQQLVKDQAAYY